MNEAPNLSKVQSYLIEGVKRITACLGSFDDFHESEVKHPEHLQTISKNFGLANAENINWDGNIGDLNKKKFLNNGGAGYVFSTVDNSNKFSKDFVPCTGLIVAGIDKETGEEISFLSHQAPSEVLNLQYSNGGFESHLKERLSEMKERCKAGTIDAVIVGGSYVVDRYEAEGYLKSIKFIGAEVKKAFGFEPTVINGPKISLNDEDADDVYYDNKNRRLYFLRPKVNSDTKDFIPSAVDQEKDKWK